MPKKYAKNACSYNMVDNRKEQKIKHVNYSNLSEVAHAATPTRNKAPHSLKTQYEKYNKASEVKYTSTGVSLADIDREEKELKDAEDAERRDIKNIIKLKSFNGELLIQEDFYLIDVNYYCKTGTDFLIAECTAMRFNLEEGIKDQYHEIINPGHIPVGYAYETKIGSQEIGLDMPDETQGLSNYFQILANLIDYLKQNNRNAITMPPLFTMPDKLAPVQNFIIQMCNRAAEDYSLFRIYKLDLLFFMLINEIKTHRDEGFPRESLALAQLKQDRFKYNPGLGCEIHEITDKSVNCTTSRVKRWAFTILDSCCPLAGVELRPGHHVPADYDIETIIQYKERNIMRAGPSVAGSSITSSPYDTSSLSEPFDNAASSSTKDSTTKEKRTHVPLRMPKTDYSQIFRQAPELTEANFPSLRSGHGRGRGLALNFSKMNLKK